jgi:hypothetical protein
MDIDLLMPFAHSRVTRNLTLLVVLECAVCRVAGFTAAILRTSALTAAFGLIEPIFISNRLQNK